MAGGCLGEISRLHDLYKDHSGDDANPRKDQRLRLGEISRLHDLYKDHSGDDANPRKDQRLVGCGKPFTASTFFGSTSIPFLVTT